MDNAIKIIGQGVLAGAVGLVGLLLSREIEKKVLRQNPGFPLAKATDELLDINQPNRVNRARFNFVIESLYDSGWGIFRSFLGSRGIVGPGASALHLVAIGANVSVLMPALGVVPPVRKWDKKELAFQLMHHTVYVTFVGVAYDCLNRSH